jgi:hypothetical protein
MSAAQLALQKRTTDGQNGRAFVAGGLAKKIGIGLNRIFGCWHSEMSRPFSIDGQSYKACIDCGARRQFDTGSWETRGDFYYRLPTSQHFRALNGLVTR